MDNLFFALIFLSALGCGLISGVFFAFSTFVMKGLSRLPPTQAIAAMQSINITAVMPVFMIALFGTAAVCAILVPVSFLMWHKPGGPYLFIGSLTYLAGAIVVTVVCNVPLNNVLADTNAAAADSSTVWPSYLATWTLWNHVRAGASLIAATLFIVALCKVSGTSAAR